MVASAARPKDASLTAHRRDILGLFLSHGYHVCVSTPPMIRRAIACEESRAIRLHRGLKRRSGMRKSFQKSKLAGQRWDANPCSGAIPQA
jgi:hypothetical protein